MVVSSSGKCMDVNGDSTAPLAEIHQYRCGTGLNQQWNLQPVTGGYKVVSQRSNLCLAVASNSTVTGMILVQNSCNADASQVWNFTASGSGYQLVNGGSGLCASVTGNSTADGVTLSQNPCGTGADFIWTVSAGLIKPTTLVNLQVGHSGKCLNVSGASTGTGARVIQYGCKAPPAVSTNEQWRLEPSGSNYRVVAQHSNLCLAISGGSSSVNATAVQVACGSAGSLWTLRPQGKLYQLVAQHSGQCLTLPSSSQNNDVQLTQTGCGTGLNQQWALSRATLPAQWSTKFSVQVNPIAVANLPNGKLLMWSAYRDLSFQGDIGGSNSQTYTSIFNPADRSSTKVLVTNTGDDMFCPGTTNLPDGRVLVNGGSSSSESSIYDSVANSWASSGDMVRPRGYQANTLVPGGSVFTLGGSWSGGSGGKNGELWTAGTWRALSGVPVTDFLGQGEPGGVFRSDNHMWLFSVSNGRIFHAGPSTKMHWVTVVGSGSVALAGNRDAYSINGSATLYAPNLIMKTGGAPAYEGSSPIATTSTYVIQLNPATPSVTTRQVAPMTYARAFCNSVVLPNGQVLEVGGQTTPRPFNDATAILAPELWDPETQVFRVLPPMVTPRTYHSTAILLPDATVFVGGGGQCGSCTTNHLDVEILSPPYLLTGETRPNITAAPTTGALGGTLAVTTSIPVASFALVRLSSTTHTVNNDQRRVPLTINGTSGATDYTLGIPSDAGVVLPGHYMLFALSASGVPSVSKNVSIN